MKPKTASAPIVAAFASFALIATPALAQTSENGWTISTGPASEAKLSPGARADRAGDPFAARAGQVGIAAPPLRPPAWSPVQLPAPAATARVADPSVCASELSDAELSARLVHPCYDGKHPPPQDVMDRIEAMLHDAGGEFQTRYHIAASWTGGYGSPVTLTWSIVPDGLLIPGSPTIGDPDGNSNLVAKLDSDFGDHATWVALMTDAFARWGAFTGVTYQYVSDDGAAWGSPGAAGLRGDIRIGGHHIDGSFGIAAYNYFPTDGNMVLDTDEPSWANPSPSHLIFYNVISHEHGHGLGIYHNCPVSQTKLMEPFISTAFVGAQHDDVRAGMALYGDAFESNNTVATATNLGDLNVGQSVNPSTLPALPEGSPPANTTRTAIDVAGDNDYYRINVLGPATLNVQLTPIGYSYDNQSQSGSSCPSGGTFDSLRVARLALQVIATDGTTVEASAQASQSGNFVQVSGPIAAGQHYIRAYSTDSPSESQMYSLVIALGAPPAPANDSCANAQTLIPGTTIAGNNSGATTDGATTCPGTSGADVWYVVTPPCSGTLTLDTCGSNFNTVLSVHTGACGALVSVACNDDQGSGTCPSQPASSRVSVAVTAGTTYHVRVAGFQGAIGNFNLSTTLAGPSNDDCANATPAQPNNDYDGATCGAHPDGQATCGISNSAPDVWYSYTPPSDLTLILDTCQATTFDTVLSVYSGTCGNLVEVACNDDAGSAGPCPGTLYSYLAVPLTGGTPYRIRVAGYGGASGTFRLHVAASYVNDTCANATTISNGTYSGSTVFASSDGVAACGNSTSSPDVWYRYVPACNTNLVLDTCGSNFDTVLSVHTGSCGSLTLVDCNDDAGQGTPCFGTFQSYLSVPVNAGTPYFIRVSGYSNATGQFNLHVSTPVPNDACGGAIPLGDGTVAFDTRCATPGGTASCGLSNSAPDVWYSYTTPCSSVVSMSLCGSSYDTVLSVYGGNCGGLTEIACNDDGLSHCPTNPYASYLEFAATAGTTYRIRVAGYNGASGAGMLTISHRCRGDMNCDGVVNAADVAAFDLALLDPAGYAAQFPGCQISNADMNGDSLVDGEDIGQFVELIGG